MDEALDGAPAGHARAERLADLADLSMLQGDWPAVRRLALDALADAGDDVPLRIQLHLTLAAVGFITYAGWAEAAGHAAEAMRLADGLGDPALLAGTIGHYATWRWVTEHRIPHDLIERARELEPWTGHLRAIDHPDYDFVRMASTEGDRARATALLEGLVRRAEEGGDYASLVYLLANLAEQRIRGGDVDLALAGHERADRLARSIGQDTALVHSLIWRAAAFARLGREPEARAADAEARSLIARTGWRVGEPALAEHMAALDLSLGDAAAAHERLASARERLLSGIEDPPWQRELVPGDVEALVALGRLDEARPLLEVFEAGAQRRGRTPELADGLRARGVLLAAAGDVEGATDALRRAIAAYDALDDPWGRARSLFALGQVHRRARRRAQAHEALSQAGALFERLGARIWTDRARRELERGAPRRADGPGLTETQRRVAELVGAGRTNREVADALFMSPHTVEAHLTAIYRELGVRSRVELARVVGSAGPGDRDVGSDAVAND